MGEFLALMWFYWNSEFFEFIIVNFTAVLVICCAFKFISYLTEFK